MYQSLKNPFASTDVYQINYWITEYKTFKVKVDKLVWYICEFILVNEQVNNVFNKMKLPQQVLLGMLIR